MVKFDFWIISNRSSKYSMEISCIAISLFSKSSLLQGAHFCKELYNHAVCSLTIYSWQIQTTLTSAYFWLICHWDSLNVSPISIWQPADSKKFSVGIMEAIAKQVFFQHQQLSCNNHAKKVLSSGLTFELKKN